MTASPTTRETSGDLRFVARSTCGSRGRVGDLDPLDRGPWREHVRPHPHAAGDLAHRDPSDDKCIRDERSVAAPWNGLRAHQHDIGVPREINTPIQTSSERCRLHVVGIPAESRISPPAVRRVSPRVSQSAQTRHMRVPHSGCTQGTAEQVAVELRVVTRSWNGADVNDTFDVVGREQTDEFVDGPCRMPDGQDRQWRHRASRNCRRGMMG